MLAFCLSYLSYVAVERPSLNLERTLNAARQAKREAYSEMADVEALSSDTAIEMREGAPAEEHEASEAGSQSIKPKLIRSTGFPGC